MVKYKNRRRGKRVYGKLRRPKYVGMPRTFRHTHHLLVDNNSQWGKRTTTMFSNGPQFCPDRALVKLSFGQTITRSATAGFLNYIYRANSIYDPQFTVGGATVQGLQEWSAFYSKYRVHASSIQITVDNSVIGTGCYYALVPSPDATLPILSGPSEFDLLPRAKSGFVSGSTGGIAVNRMKHFITTAASAGVRRSHVKDEDDFAALTNANPAFPVYWHVLLASTSSGINTAFVLNVKIKYYVEFFGRKQPIATANSDTTDDHDPVEAYDSTLPIFDPDLEPPQPA